MDGRDSSPPVDGPSRATIDRGRVVDVLIHHMARHRRIVAAAVRRIGSS
ncbi:MAG: hypothetical protein RLZZ461_898 [Planctomycetota bacterium]